MTEIKIGDETYGGIYMGISANGDFAYIMAKEAVHDVTHDEAMSHINDEWFIPTLSEFETIGKNITYSVLEFNEEQIWSSSKNTKLIPAINLYNSGINVNSIHKNERISARLFKLVPLSLLSKEYIELKQKYILLENRTIEMNNILVDISERLDAVLKSSRLDAVLKSSRLDVILKSSKYRRLK
jgi:hypothetical protein